MVNWIHSINGGLVHRGFALYHEFLSKTRDAKVKLLALKKELLKLPRIRSTAEV